MVGEWRGEQLHEAEAYLGTKLMGFLNGIKLEGQDPWPSGTRRIRR